MTNRDVAERKNANRAKNLSEENVRVFALVEVGDGVEFLTIGMKHVFWIVASLSNENRDQQSGAK